MTTNQRLLPPDLIFDPDGHVTEVCLSCVADGEIDIVPQAALDHLDACDACGDALGQAALRVVTVHEALREAKVATDVSLAPVTPRKVRRPMPIAAIAAALLIAAVTAWPALVDAIATMPKLVTAAVGWVPTLVRVAAAVAWSGPSMGPWAIALKGVSVVLFVLAGLSVARIASKRRAVILEGGVR